MAQQTQVFEKIFDVNFLVDPDFQSIAAIPGGQGFVVVAEEDAVDNKTVLMRLDSTGDIVWETTVSGIYSTQMVNKNDRLAYFKDDSTQYEYIVLIGQSEVDPDTLPVYLSPTYVVFNAIDGSYIKTENFFELEGTFNSVKATQTYGVFMAGATFEGDIKKGLVVRVDLTTSGNDWAKIIYNSGDDIREYMDLAIDVTTNKIALAGTRRGGNINDQNRAALDILTAAHGAYIRSYTSAGSVIKDIAFTGNNNYAIVIDAKKIALVSAVGNVMWQTNLEMPNNDENFKIIELEKDIRGNLVLIYSYREIGDPYTGITGLSMNGKLLQEDGKKVSRKFPRSIRINDVIPLESSGFGVIIKNDGSAQNHFIHVDNNYRYGCEDDQSLVESQNQGDFEQAATPSEDIPVKHAIQLTVESPQNAESVNGPCCLLPFDPFEYRYIYYCDSATITYQDHFSGNGLNYKWYNETGTLHGETSHKYGPVELNGEEVQFSQVYTLEVTDDEGCKGSDKARVRIVDSQTRHFMDTTLKQRYCESSSTYLPDVYLAKDAQVIGSWYYEESHPPYWKIPIPEGEITHSNNSFLANPGIHTNVYKGVTDPVTSCSYYEQYIYAVDVCTDCASPSVTTINFWEDQWPDNDIVIYGITAPASVNWNFYSYTFFVRKAGLPDIVITMGWGYPELSSYWLKGLGNQAANDFELCFEGRWPGGGGICDYQLVCAPSLVTVAARKAKMSESEDNIEYLLEQNNIRIYPNPTSGKIYIESTDKIEGVELFNSMGQKMILTTRKETEGISLDISDSPSGMYVIRIVYPEGKVLKRIIRH